MRPILRILVFCVFASIAICVFADDAEQVRQTRIRWETVRQTYDPQQLLPLATGSKDAIDAFSARMTSGGVYQKIKAVAKEKNLSMGPALPRQTDVWGGLDPASFYKDFSVDIQGEIAYLRHPSTHTGPYLRKVDGVWRIPLSECPEASLPFYLRALQHEYERLLKQLEDGSIKDDKTFAAALAQTKSNASAAVAKAPVPPAKVIPASDADLETGIDLAFAYLNCITTGDTDVVRLLVAGTPEQLDFEAACVREQFLTRKLSEAMSAKGIVLKVDPIPNRDQVRERLLPLVPTGLTAWILEIHRPYNTTIEMVPYDGLWRILVSKRAKASVTEALNAKIKFAEDALGRLEKGELKEQKDLSDTVAALAELDEQIAVKWTGASPQK